jgi:cyclopropane fatty-acyl-phospholipid synthase-like methyltransferase
MSNAYSGHYPIEPRMGEIERLRIQAEVMAFETGAMLDRFGLMQGWSCLDIGCGPGGITDPPQRARRTHRPSGWTRYE